MPRDPRRRQGHNKRREPKPEKRGNAQTAHNCCLRCSHEWWDRPGPHTVCPKCGHEYVEWVNYQ